MISHPGNHLLLWKILDTLFNKTIFYIYSQTEDQKRILINKFAWSLSNEEGAVNLFEDILNYMEAQS